MSDSDTIRARFENECKGHFLITEVNEAGCYNNALTNAAWWGYKLGQARQGDEARPDVIKFLLGLGTLEGYWFGDKPTDGRGAFWWRKYFNYFLDTKPPTSDKLRDLVVILEGGAEIMNGDVVQGNDPYDVHLVERYNAAEAYLYDGFKIIQRDGKPTVYKSQLTNIKT